MSKYNMHRVLLFSREYIFLESSDGNGPIAIREQCENFECSYAYLKHGIIWQHHEVIGSLRDLTFLGPAEDIKIKAGLDTIFGAVCNPKAWAQKELNKEGLNAKSNK